jgi:hypothetical protein
MRASKFATWQPAAEKYYAVPNSNGKPKCLGSMIWFGPAAGVEIKRGVGNVTRHEVHCGLIELVPAQAVPKNTTDWGEPNAISYFGSGLA